MARPPLQPAFTPVKKEPDADTTATAAARPPHPLTHKKHRQDRLPVTPTQPLLTPQTIPSATPRADSFTIKRCRELGVTPGTLPTSIKREPDADKGAGGRSLGTPPRKKRRVHCLPGTPSQSLFTPRTTTLSGISRADSSVDKWSEQPTTAHASVKREPGTDDGKDEGGKVVGRRRRPYPHARPMAAETPTMWLNRGRLSRFLHDLARTHRWRDASGVFSVLLPAIQHPCSFEEAHSIFVAAKASIGDLLRTAAAGDVTTTGRRNFLMFGYGIKFGCPLVQKPFGRLWGDETVPTVVTRAEPHNQAILHPKQARVLTVRENARLQGFLDYYRMDGPIKQRYMQVGNAVAVPVARALGYSLGLAYLRKQEGSDDPLFVLPPNFFSPGQTEAIARASSARLSAGEECRTQRASVAAALSSLSSY